MLSRNSTIKKLSNQDKSLGEELSIDIVFTLMLNNIWWSDFLVHYYVEYAYARQPRIFRTNPYGKY